MENSKSTNIECIRAPLRKSQKFLSAKNSKRENIARNYVFSAFLFWFASLAVNFSSVFCLSQKKPWQWVSEELWKQKGERKAKEKENKSSRVTSFRHKRVINSSPPRFFFLFFCDEMQCHSHTEKSFFYFRALETRRSRFVEPGAALHVLHKGHDFTRFLNSLCCERPHASSSAFGVQCQKLLFLFC